MGAFWEEKVVGVVGQPEQRTNQRVVWWQEQQVVRWPEQPVVWMFGCPELTSKIQTVSNINK